MSKVITHPYLPTSSPSAVIVPKRNIDLEAIYFRIVIHNVAPTVAMTARITDLNGRLIGESVQVLKSDVTALDYWLGLVRFTLKKHLRESATYVLKLGLSSYTGTDSSYVALTSDHDYQIGFKGRVPFSYSRLEVVKSPIDLILIERYTDPKGTR